MLELDPSTGTARQVARLDGYLTSASGADPEDIARQYLRAHPDVFGLTAGQIQGLTLRKQYTDVAGIRHLSFVQSVDGVPVFGNGVKANVARDGRLISVLGSPVRKLPSQLAPAKVTGAQARKSAVRDIAGGKADGTGGADIAKQVVYPTSDGTARRAWQTVTSPDGHGMWLHVVDAATGRVLYRQNLSSDLEAAGATAAAPGSGQPLSSSPATPLRTGKVLAWDYSPGAATGGKQHTRHLDARGWLPVGAKTLDGPIAHVYSDTNDNNKTDDGEEIAPAADGTFSFPFKPFTGDNCGPAPCSWDQKTPYSWQANREQNASQVFYFVGNFHDHLARPVGFTRAAGNFEGGTATPSRPRPSTARTSPAACRTATTSTTRTWTRRRRHAAAHADVPVPRARHRVPGEDPYLAGQRRRRGRHHVPRVHPRAVEPPRRRRGRHLHAGQLQAGAMGEAWSDWYADGLPRQHGLFEPTARRGRRAARRRVRRRGQRPDPHPAARLPGRRPLGQVPWPAGRRPRRLHLRRLRPDRRRARGARRRRDLGRDAVGPAQGARHEADRVLVTRAMELSPANPSFLDMRNSILQADTVVNGGAAHDHDLAGLRAPRHGLLRGRARRRRHEPVEDFSLPPGRTRPRARHRHRHRHRHACSRRGRRVVGSPATTPASRATPAPPIDAAGRYTIAGTARSEPTRTCWPAARLRARDGRHVQRRGRRADDNHQPRRDWAAASGGGEITAFTGDDNSPFGCGPAG